MGVYNTAGQPEIITAGLRERTALVLLNEAGKRLREGVDLTQADERYAQPLMQVSAPMTVVEEGFWASADPKSSLFDWKFPDPPHTRVSLSEAVHQGTEAVTYVPMTKTTAPGSSWRQHV